MNSLVIIALQMVMIRLTGKRSGPTLLMIVGGIWAASWILLGSAQFAPELAAAIFVTTFGVFAVGETMYAPILNPLTAQLAPDGLVGTTLGVFTALQTGISATGPLLAGVLLGAGLSGVFLGLHLLISLAAVGAAWRLRMVIRRPASPVTEGVTSPVDQQQRVLGLRS